MRTNPSPKLQHLLPLYLACYALWLALVALGGVLIWEARSAMFALAVWLHLNPWQVRAIDQFGVVTLGLVWLVAILLLEDYLRKGVIKGRLWSRAARVIVFQALLLALCIGVQALLS